MAELREVPVPSGVSRLLHEECIVFYQEFRKFNYYWEPARRFIVITRLMFFNARRTMWGTYRVKREFPVCKIFGIVRQGDSFVLKLENDLPSDYIYAGSSPDSLIEVLQILNPWLKVWTITDSLYSYIRTETTPAKNNVLMIEDDNPSR